MRAAAVLGPGLDESALNKFRLPGIEITLLKNLPREATFDAALIFGGDGTVHHQLPVLAKTETPLLLVPTGSGNDFAIMLGIHSRDEALALWKNFQSGSAKIRQLDLGVIKTGDGGETLFCNVMGVGLDAAANRLANAWPRWLRAHGGYPLAAIAAMLSAKPQKIKVLRSSEDGEWTAWLHEPATLVAVGNAPSYGGGMRITPRALADDGKLDVCFVRKCGTLRLLRLFPRVYQGGHLNLPEIEYLLTEHVRIETESPMDIYADGEYAGRIPAEIGLLPRALRVIASA